MDIKLKDRHRISAALTILVVLAAALIMVGLYPFFEREAARWEEPAYEEPEFLKHLVLGNYVLALEEAQYEQGNMMSPFEYFFPEAQKEWKADIDSAAGAGYALEEEMEADAFNDEEWELSDRMGYIYELRQECIREYENWNWYFGSMKNAIDYQILDENGRILSDHAKGRYIPGSNEYVFKAVLHYDELGRMEVASVSGENTVSLQNLLQSFGDSDPMNSFYLDDYLYEPELKLHKPRNLTFAYGMTKQQLLAFTESQGSSQSVYHSSRCVSRVFAGLSCAAALLAFLIACMDATWAEDRKFLRAPFELAAGVGGSAFVFGENLVGLVVVTNRGDLYSTLLRADFLPAAAELMVKLWNVMWWSVSFGGICWFILCIQDMFHIGLVRYLKERTLLARLVRWFKHQCKRIYRFAGDVNLQERSNRAIFRIVGLNFVILAVLCNRRFFLLIFYSGALFLIMRKYYRDLSYKYQRLLEATNQIAEGNLEVTIEEDLGVFEPFKREIQKIQSGFKVAVEEEVKSQKLKTDLISNMSHDLKTPLTAIITYVNLLKDEHAALEQRRAYIDILEQRSMRLKSLIEDLFEISKANSNNVTLNLVEVDIVSLLKEVSLELSDKIEESTIDFRWNLPEEKIVLLLDSQKTYRIFDNLLTNIIKYAMPHSRAYIDLKTEGGFVVISMKNVSSAELSFNPEEITDRFVRGDQSRNTEGSGLGMAIAKSFVELQNGKLCVEVEADLFRVIIRWPLLKEKSF